jgi:transcriptional regulator with XRE-family HTH domain
MKIANQLTDEQALTELGQRIVQLRLARNWTQAELAQQAGVSKHTVERLEAGESLQLTNLIRVCRALDLLEGLDALIPTPKLSPIVQLKMRGKTRQRASSPKATPRPAKQWSWGDE